MCKKKNFVFMNQRYQLFIDKNIVCSVIFAMIYFSGFFLRSLSHRKIYNTQKLYPNLLNRENMTDANMKDYTFIANFELCEENQIYAVINMRWV